MNNPDAKPHSSRVPALLIVLAAFLLLGYVGSRFVLEVILHRA